MFNKAVVKGLGPKNLTLVVIVSVYKGKSSNGTCRDNRVIRLDSWKLK